MSFQYNRSELIPVWLVIATLLSSIIALAYWLDMNSQRQLNELFSETQTRLVNDVKEILRDESKTSDVTAMTSSLQKIKTHYPGLYFSLATKSTSGKERQIFQSNPKSTLSKADAFKPLHRINSLQIGHQSYVLQVATLAQFGQYINRYLSVYIIIFGFVVSILILLVMWILLKARHRAELVITDQTHELIANESRLKLVFSNVGDGILGLDKSGIIIFANHAVTRILGFEEDELIGLDFHNLIHHSHPDNTSNPETHSKILTNLLQAKPHHVENEVFCNKAGHPIDVEYSSSPLIEEQFGIQGVVLIFRDITERKKTQQALLTANEELEEFAYRTSHDLRAPLKSTQGLLEHIQKFIKQNDNVNAFKCLDMASDMLSKLENLVQDILTLTETQHLQEENTTILIDELLNETLLKLNHMEGFDNITFKKTIKSQNSLISKKSRMTLILENLLSNSIKYQDPNEPQPEVNITFEVRDDLFFIEIEDNGLGIPENKRHELFEMFKRFHPRVSYGSGLGLYMIKKSMDILGGTIEVTFKDKGVAFILKLPLGTQDEDGDQKHITG